MEGEGGRRKRMMKGKRRPRTTLLFSMRTDYRDIKVDQQDEPGLEEKEKV